jgi:hypothetical protein
MDRKCVRIEIEYEDGTVEYQTGDAAQEVWSWFMSGEQMNCIHGAQYHGTKLLERKATS